MMEFDQRGIAHDVKESSSGYTFYLDCSDGTSMKCFSRKKISELGHYGVSGSFSDDRSIFFVSDIMLLDSSSGEYKA